MTAFKGLAVETYENKKPVEEQWLVYPVLKFSLSGGAYQTEEGFSNTLRFSLEQFEGKYSIAHKAALDLPTQFRWCIREAYRITGRKVVVLVDEYDKPLLETMMVNPELEEKNRILFKSFYSILKDEDEYLRFGFFTGVTEFSQISIFSDLNQLKDISLADRYAGICGITEEELHHELDENVTVLAEKEGCTAAACYQMLKEMYDGYRFSAEGMCLYNPFSILNAFSDLRFGRYWYSTGTPTFLIHVLQRSRFRPADFKNGIRTTEQNIMDYRADNPDPVPLFYQSGYLTIAGYDRRLGQYELKFPNLEVEQGFADSLFPYYFRRNESDGVFEIDRFIDDLDHENVDGFMTGLKS